MGAMTYEIVYCCVAICATVGAIVGAIFLFLRMKKIKSHFKIDKGMSYEQILAILGEPLSKTERGRKINCKWNSAIDGKRYVISALFVDGIAKNIF